MSHKMIVSDGMLLARANAVEGAMYRQSKELGRLNSAVKRYKDENATLRERVAELEELLPDSGRWYRAETVEAYVAEIAKLRELVREMHATISDRNSWWDCTYKDTRRFADRMCELGIEVG